MQYTPRFQEILDKLDKLIQADTPIESIQEFFRETVKALPAEERLNNLYRIRPKDPIPGETSRYAQFKFNRMQADYHKNHTHRDLILKMRQGGVTTYSCILALDMALWSPNTSSAIMAHVLPRVKDIFKIIKNAFIQFQKDWGSFYPVHTRFDNANELVIAETGSTLRVCTETKGLTLDLLHLSEACFIPDDRIIESIESVPESGRIIMESTPNGVSGLFYEMWQMWFNGETCAYKGHFYPWWYHYPEEQNKHLFKPTANFKPTEKEEMLMETNNLSIEQIVWRRKKVSESGGDESHFSNQYPEDAQTCFLSGANNVFPNEVLITLWRNQRNPSFCGDLVSL